MVRRKNEQTETTENIDVLEPSFEEALDELELIVKLMEEGNLNLDEALAKFEKGIVLSRVCSRKLEQAEKKIDILICSEKGELILEPAKFTEDNDE